MIQRRIPLPSLIQYTALLVSAALMIVDLYWGDGLWWLAAIVCLALGIIYDHWPGGRYDHSYFTVHLALLAALLALHPVGMMGGFAFSAEVMSFYPNRTGWRWMAALMAVAFGLLIVRFGVVDGAASGVGVGLGYLSFGYFSFARVKADSERRHSQALLAELQEAHRQLKQYAGRAEEMAVQGERARLAREMHDTLGHRLTVAAVQLEGAQRLVETDPQRAGQMIAVVRVQVSEALADLRRTVAALRLPLEVDLPLEAALARLAHNFAAAAGIIVHLSQPEQPVSLPAPQRLALYRAAQEGLTNIQRHAHARQAWLEVAQVDGGTQVTISDDGDGLSEQATQAGFGLRGLQERAERLGGAMWFNARSGGGAQLRFWVPNVETEDDPGGVLAAPDPDKVQV